VTCSTLNITPATYQAAGAVSNTETTDRTDFTVFRTNELFTAFERSTRPGYFDWLRHVQAAAGCTRPIRLVGTLHTVTRTGDTATVLDTTSTEEMPDGVIYKPCGNRRARVCPACSRTYQGDAFHLLRAGLVGGRGVSETVTTHPAVFATFTAPSFGPVHSRHIRRHTCASRKLCDCRPEPCHARRDHGLCVHGRAAVCFARHEAEDARLGEPLCLDCYDHDGQVVWNLFAGKLWHRTKQAIERHLAKTAKRRGIPLHYIATANGKLRSVSPVRVSHGKVAEFQARGAVHFHALLRLDGVDSDDPTAVVAPPAGISVQDLHDAINAAAHCGYGTPGHPERPTGWRIVWGEQIDVRTINLSGRDEISDGMVAGYLAKYATKATEATGHSSTRITLDNLASLIEGDGHTARLIAACWRLGRNHRPLRVDPADDDAEVYLRLRRWAHMLGFGGHFLTKARHYTATFAQLREARAIYRRDLNTTTGQTTPVQPVDHDQNTTLVVGLLTFAGTGWHTNGDALLANTAAAQALDRQRAARDLLSAGLLAFAVSPAIAA
jgi:hypothetical protein